MTFNPEKHLIELQGKAYLEVKWRLCWFNELCPEGKITIIDKHIEPDREIEKEVPTGNWIPNPNRPGKKMPEKVLRKACGWAYFHVRVEDGKGRVGEAVKSECAVDFDDYIEKANTGATGRALAMIGFGTQHTGDELNEEHRIVDAPVERANSFQYANNGSNGNGKPAVASVTNANGQQSDEKLSSTPATEQQLASLRKLCQHLGKPEPEGQGAMTYLSAKELILQLSREYNESRQSRKAS